MFATAGWLLLKRAPPLPEQRGDTALDVTWVERLPSPPPLAAPASPAPSPPRTAAARPSRADVPPPPREAARATAPAAGDRPLRAVSIEQARDWARREAPPPDFAPDPLRGRLQAERTVERFEWSPPPTPADVVRAIGTVFGGSGYTTDPCPQVRQNIARLSTGGHDDLLQEELRRQAAFCR